MARTTLLDTHTVNYQELIGNGRAYHVPQYQRDYFWRREQWEDLWNDIAEMRDPEDGRHYMGALVVEPRSDRRFVVIDGQQRFATLSVLTLAAIEALQRLAANGARGLELTTTDLLKNYLFAKASSSDRPSMLRRWQRIAATVGQQNVLELLRYHMLCEEPKVRSRRLFKLVRDRYRSPRDVYDLLEVLESRAEVFAAVKDPAHGYWVEVRDARRYITELNVFRVTQMMPLLFVVWEEWPERDFVRTLKLVCTLAFRYTVVSRQNPNDLESAYHRASKAVKDGAVRGPGELFAVLKGIYVSDERTATDFTFLSIPTRGPRKRLVKYILARLEEDESGKPCDHETDPGTIEHILPENAGAAWEDEFPLGGQDTVVNRIGNLTLLEAGLNREVANASYTDKAQAYARSRYSLTKAVLEMAPEDWTPARLDARQRRFADRVVHLWRADFA